MKQTSKQWCKQFGIELGRDIIDPDGWDRTNFTESFHQEEISFEEFQSRVIMSTIWIDAQCFDRMDQYS